jgi:hypothetical protein
MSESETYCSAEEPGNRWISGFSFLFSSKTIPESLSPMMDLHARSNRMDPWVGIGMNVDIPADPHPLPRPMVDEDCMGGPEKA